MTVNIRPGASLKYLYSYLMRKVKSMTKIKSVVVVAQVAGFVSDFSGTPYGASSRRGS